MGGRINKKRTDAERGVDAYFTCPEAIRSLMAIEQLPVNILEPACGDGAIAKPLLDAGHNVVTTDIIDYGFPRTEIANYLTAPPCFEANGVVTNPPFKLGIEFARKAVQEFDYVALLLRFNWLETPARKAFFAQSGLSRVWLSSRRLPAMHRHGYVGKKTSSNTAYAWYVWDRREGSFQNSNPQLKFFDWKDFC